MRISYLDTLRGLAVIWMILFHGAYDLTLLKFVNWDFSTGFWYAFPRVIAFTFLFCVGISLWLTHRNGLNLRSLRKRTLTLGAAALLVSLGTYFAFPSQWIFFGTLHCILVGSLLGAPLVRFPSLTWPLMFLIMILQYLFHFDIKWVSSIIQKPSMDFIPIYPWFWAILLGMNFAPLLSRISLLNRLRSGPVFDFLGRHSLKIYLLHQPLIFGVLWIIRSLV
jgi:uncharacterized membrane protein